MGPALVAEHVLADVVEEHLEEASFLLAQRACILDSARHDLQDLALQDARLLAHVDALALHGAAYFAKLPDALHVLLGAKAESEHQGGEAEVRRALAAYSEEGAAALQLALTDTPAARHALTALRERSSSQHAALFATGFTGCLAQVPSLLSLLDDADLRMRKLAAEAVFNITGLQTPALAESGEDALPKLEDDLARDLTFEDVDALPLPDARALRVCWAQRAGALEVGVRLLRGVPWTLEAALDALATFSLRHRPPIALWLTLHSGGRTSLDTRALAHRQQRALAALRAGKGR